MSHRIWIERSPSCSWSSHWPVLRDQQGEAADPRRPDHARHLNQGNGRDPAGRRAPQRASCWTPGQPCGGRFTDTDVQAAPRCAAATPARTEARLPQFQPPPNPGPASCTLSRTLADRLPVPVARLQARCSRFISACSTPCRAARGGLLNGIGRLPWPRKTCAGIRGSRPQQADAWERHCGRPEAHAFPRPGTRLDRETPARHSGGRNRPSTDVAPSFVDLLAVGL